jgi:long-chain acyl-CoA synthetase
MDKIWLRNYPAGVPADINPTRVASLQALLERSFEKFADRPAYTLMDRTLTYADLDRLSRQFAAYLQKVAGLKKGDRLAIMLPNILQYPVAIAAAFRAGLTIVNTNPLYTPRELEHQLKDSGAKAILILENFAHTLEGARRDRDRDGDRHRRRRPARLPEVAARELRAAPRAKQVPEYSLPGSVGFTRRSARASTRTSSPCRSGTTTSPSCSTPAAPPACRRAPCSPTATWSRTCCRRRRGWARRCATRPGRWC